MNHSGNVATIVDKQYLLGEVLLRVYVHDEVGRFVTVANLTVSDRYLARMREGIEQTAIDHAASGQQVLPPWQ